MSKKLMVKSALIFLINWKKKNKKSRKKQVVIITKKNDLYGVIILNPIMYRVSNYIMV